MNEKTNIDDLALLRSYFSYNMRTSTSVILASVTVLQLELDEETDNMTDAIIESSYFLDIYDKGMEICFDYAMGKDIKTSGDKISPSKIVAHFISKIPNMIKEHNIMIEFSANDYIINDNAKIVKIILETILCEIFKSSEGKVIITALDNKLTFKLQKQIQNIDQIFAIFIKYLKLVNVDMSFNNNEIMLRF